MKTIVGVLGSGDFLAKLKEAQEKAERAADEEKANENKLRDAGYGDEAICLLNACLYVARNPDPQGWSRIGHLAQEHDILEAGQAFAAYCRFVEKALAYIRRAEHSAGITLLGACDDAVRGNREQADHILATLKAKYANLREAQQA